MFNPQKKKNCDGHPYHPDLRLALNASFGNLQIRPNVKVGIQRLGYGQYESHVDSVPFDNELSNADIIHHASIKGRVYPMFEAIDGYNGEVILVAPKYLDSPLLPFRVDHFIEIPEKNCWAKREEITDKMRSIASKGSLFILCASMMANVLIYDLFDQYFSMIDMGSVLDPYVGKHTRSYHKNLNLKK